MDKKKINRIIDFVREEMMTTGKTPGKPGFSGKIDEKGPTAGFDPVCQRRLEKDISIRRD